MAEPWICKACGSAQADLDVRCRCGRPHWWTGSTPNQVDPSPEAQRAALEAAFRACVRGPKDDA